MAARLRSRPSPGPWALCEGMEGIIDNKGSWAMADGKRGGRCSVFLRLRLPVAHLEGFLDASLDATGACPLPPPWLPQYCPLMKAG